MAEIGTRDPTSSVARMLTWILQDRLVVTAYNSPEVDLHKTAFPDNTFDITVADQVLEHTQRPWLCAEELWRITKQGSLCIVATPITRGLTGDWLSMPQAKDIVPNYGPETDGLWPVVAWLVGRKR